MEDVGGGDVGDLRDELEPSISGQSGKTSADDVAVTFDPNRSNAKVTAVVKGRETA